MSDPTRSTEEGSEDSSRSPAWCLHCGYDLRGLELPRPCPECGQVADPSREREAVRSFMTGWKSWFWFLMPSRKIPAGILYLLDDPDSRRMAKRRAFLCWWLPAILGTALVLIGQQIVIERTMTRHFYRKDDPTKQVVFERHYEEKSRPYWMNLHLHGLFEQYPDGFADESSYRIDRIRFSTEVDFDPLILVFIGPIWVVMSGFLIVLFDLKHASRRSDSKAALPPIEVPVCVAGRLLLSLIGMAFWLWWIMLVCVLIMYVLPEAYILSSLAIVLFVASGVPVAVVILVVIPRVVMLDKARRLFASPLLGVLVLWLGVAIGAGVMTLALWGIAELAEMFT